MKAIRLRELIRNLPDDTEIVTIDHLGNEDEPFLIHTKDKAVILVARTIAELYLKENSQDLIL